MVMMSWENNRNMWLTFVTATTHCIAMYDLWVSKWSFPNAKNFEIVKFSDIHKVFASKQPNGHLPAELKNMSWVQA